VEPNSYQSSNAPHGLDRRGGHGAPGANQVIAPVARPGAVVARNMMRRQSDRGFNLATVLRLLLRRKKTVAAVFTLLFAPVLLYVSTRQPRYDAELKLILKKAPAPGVAATAGAGGISDVDVQAEIELLKSRGLYENAARQVGMLRPTTPAKEAALRVAAIENALKIAQVGKTNIISVKYTDTAPETAAAIPNTLAELYLRKHIDLHSTDEAARFFADQTAIYQRQLDAAQLALAQFRQTGDVTLLEEQKQAYLRRATDLEASIQEAESALRDAEQRMSTVERQRDQLPATVETGSRVARSSATVEKLKALLIDLNNKRTELVTKYDPSYRLVKEVDRQIADARTALERESQPQVVDQTHAPNPLRQGLDGELLRTQSSTAGLRARRAALQRDLADYRSRQIRLERATANHNDLERAVKIAEENFLLYQRKLEEARLAEALDKQRLLSVAVLEKAAVPALATSQHRTYFLLFGFLAAAFLAFASAFVADYLERHLPTRDTLAAEAPGAAEPAAPEPFAAPAYSQAALPPVAGAPYGAPAPARLSAAPYTPAVVQPVVQPVVAAAPVAGAPVVSEALREDALLPGNLAALVNAVPHNAPGSSVTIARQEVNRHSGQVTTTALVLSREDAWRQLFDRRSREAARSRQKTSVTQKPAGQKLTVQKPSASAPGSSGPITGKIDADFLRRVQEKKTNNRDSRTGTRG